MLLAPKVLECMHFSAKSSSEDKRRVVNYEFDLYLDGSHKINLDGSEYTDTDRCLIFRKPGQTASGRGNYNMYILTLDFSGEISDANNIFRPVSGKLQPECVFSELDAIPSVFRPYHFEELRELMEKLSECSYPGTVFPERQKQYIKEFILLVLLDAARSVRPDENTETNRHVKSACDYISKNYTKDISVKSIAAHLHVTENHLIKLFKKNLNRTPNQYILELRLIYARYLLLHSDESIQQIAYSCGFNTPSYFTKRFAERFGVLPNRLAKDKKS
ncbi:MAG: helix-turn-helix transcriptional regulator [Clostridia bacterium]|nr:helix-turn-helix transcriptional regulator [Clostridia bacterium]